MTMLGVQRRRRAAGYALPKPVVAFGLATSAWLLVCALWVGCMQTLSLLGL